MMRRLFLFALLGVEVAMMAAMASSGCSKTHCTLDSQCPAQNRCCKSECVDLFSACYDCKTEIDCDVGFQCVEKHCVPLGHVTDAGTHADASPPDTGAQDANPNHPKPIASILASATNVTAGVTISLDGSGSADPNDSDPLRYRWMLDRPAMSNSTLANTSQIRTSFTPDVAGDYVVTLIVNDTFVDSEPFALTIVATSPFTLTSTSIVDGQPFPVTNTCTGSDVQPSLSWTGVPSNTQSFAVVLIDTQIDYVHWVLYNIPASTTMLPTSASNFGHLPTGSSEAMAFCTHYCGPCPPMGSTHTYEFRAYALDTPSIVFAAADPIRNAALMAAFDAHTITKAKISATYSR
jgi:Raf kinase inhibitor-like YbhB/YbcL family protein